MYIMFIVHYSFHKRYDLSRYCYFTIIVFYKQKKRYSNNLKIITRVIIFIYHIFLFNWLIENLIY